MRHGFEVLALATLLAGPIAAQATPITGTYDLTLTGSISGSGSFFFNAASGLVTNLDLSFGDISVSNSNLGYYADLPVYSTCFVEWATSAPSTACSLYPEMTAFSSKFGGTDDIFFAFEVENVFRINIGRDEPSAGSYTAALRSVPEPGTVALFGLGLLGLGLSKRRKYA